MFSSLLRGPAGRCPSDPRLTAVTWDARWRSGSSPAHRSVGNRRQSPGAHGCRVRARRREWTARGAISVRGHVSGRARALGSSGPAPARRTARGYRVPLHLGPQSGLRFSVSLATQPGPGQLSQPVSPPPGAGLSSWAGHRAGPSLPPGSPPFRRWGTDGPSAQHPMQDSDLSCGPRAGPPGRPGAGTRRTGRASHSGLRPETQIRSRTRCLTRNPTSAPGPRVPPAFPAFRCKRRRRCNEASISPCCAVLNPHPFLSALLAASLTNTPAPPSFSLCTNPPPLGQVFVLL